MKNRHILKNLHVSNLFTKETLQRSRRGDGIVKIASSSSENQRRDLVLVAIILEKIKMLMQILTVRKKLNYTLSALKRASKRISGAVENPGFYPVAGQK